MENILKGIVVLIGIGFLLYALYWLAFFAYAVFLIVYAINEPTLYSELSKRK